MRAARRTPISDELQLRLLAKLVRYPLWLVGMAASVIGYAFQAVALFLAPVMLVQPLIVRHIHQAKARPSTQPRGSESQPA